MNETEFKLKWNSEKPVYDAWGNFIVDTISEKLQERGKNLDSFLKTPAKYRLKDEKSLIDKAFYRSSKDYADPYNEIEDKVGTRFIVLLLNDIKEICEIVENNENWVFDACKHFDEDKKNDPLLFTYQSVHYILRPKNDFLINKISIPSNITCEVQVRTLLQHAHAELTHDSIYKAKRVIQPEVHRTVAKSMALIETTDDFFSEVTQKLNYGLVEEFDILTRLDGLYMCATKIKSHTQKSSIIIWDTFERFVDGNLVDKIQSMLNDNTFLSDAIVRRYGEYAIYQQSTVLFVYWLLKNKKNRLLNDWPFPKKILDPLAIDLGISTFDD